MSDIVKVVNVHKYFDQNRTPLKVLQGINITIHSGEIVLIMGPSGTGKSTLLSLIGAIDKPTSGHIEVLGTSLDSIEIASVQALRNRSIGFIFQFHYLLPEFNVLENVMMPGIISGMHMKKAKSRALELLKLINFVDRAKERPDHLSGGERQKIALARAFFNGPELIIADEPTGSLDQENVDAVLSIIQNECYNNGRTFIIATHDQRLTSIAHRTIKLQKGICFEANGS